MRNINSMSRGNVLARTGATQYHEQLGLPDKDRKGLVVCNIKLGSRALGPAKRSGPRLL